MREDKRRWCDVKGSGNLHERERGKLRSGSSMMPITVCDLKDDKITALKSPWIDMAYTGDSGISKQDSELEERGENWVLIYKEMTKQYSRHQGLEKGEGRSWKRDADYKYPKVGEEWQQKDLV